MEPATGIEPASSSYESAALPLSYTGKWRMVQGSNLRTLTGVPLSRGLPYLSANHPLAAGEGIEPSSFRRRGFRDRLLTLSATRQTRRGAAPHYVREELLERARRLISIGRK